MQVEEQTSDGELLERYWRAGDEGAFGRLVERHSGAIYAAAKRQVRDGHLAEEVMQAVLIVLARRGRELRGEGTLAGWLMKVTWYASRDVLKRRARQTRREGRAREMIEREAMDERGDADRAWEEISPVVDDALARLNDKERGALTLRYLEDRGVREVAQILGITQTAAEKRIVRGLAKVRALLAKRGVTVAAGVLGAALATSAHAGGPAGVGPGVMEAIANGAKGAGHAGAGAAASLAKGTIVAMTMTKVKMAVIGLVAVLILATSTTVLVIVRERPAGASAATKAAAWDVATVPGTARVASENAVNGEDYHRYYDLDVGENFKAVTDVPAGARAAMFRTVMKQSAVQPVDPHSSVILSWRNERLESYMMGGGPWAFEDVLRFGFGVYPQEVEGMGKLSFANMGKGDFVVRDRVPMEEAIDDLSRMFQKNYGMPVTFGFQEVERPVLVLRGPGKAKPGMSVEIYGSDDDLADAFSWESGTWEKFAKELGYWLGKEIVVEELPAGARRVQWRLHLPKGRNSRSVEAVMPHILEQTGFMMKEESRKVRHLMVESQWGVPAEAEKAYALAPGEAIRCVKTRPEVRKAYFWDREGVILPDDWWVMLQWIEEGPTAHYYSRSTPQKEVRLKDVLAQTTRATLEKSEGDLLESVLPGDVAYDRDASLEAYREGIARMMKEEKKGDARVEIREVPRKVIVLRGEWKFTPVVGGSPGAVEIYGGDKVVAGIVALGNGDLSQVGDVLGTGIGEEVVVEGVKGAPASVEWCTRMVRQGGEKASALKNFCEQTGLAWSEEERKVRRLVVESGR